MKMTSRPLFWFAAGLATAYAYHKFMPGPKVAPKKA
jgi:hypothetical protein